MKKLILIILLSTIYSCNKCLRCEYIGDYPQYNQSVYKVCREEIPRNETLVQIEKEIEAVGYRCQINYE